MPSYFSASRPLAHSSEEFKEFNIVDKTVYHGEDGAGECLPGVYKPPFPTRMAISLCISNTSQDSTENIITLPVLLS